MKNKKGLKKLSKIKEILLGGLVVLGSVLIINLLVPELYTLFMYLLNLSVNMFAYTLIGVSTVLLVVVLGIATKCIQRETVYEFVDDYGLDERAEIQREQLYIVGEMERQKEMEAKQVKYSYVFDNNYQDVPDMVIDDMNDSYLKIAVNDHYNTRKKYRGKYLR